MLTLSACEGQYRNHGYMPPKEQIDELVVGVDTREGIIEAVGAPTISAVELENAIYYVRSRVHHRGYARPDEIDREVLVLTFGKNQVLSNSQKNKVSFLSWLEKTKNIENNSKTNISNLINDFLESNHKLSPGSETKKNKNFSKEFKISESEYMTETLAKIYFEQEKYNKALKAYEILSLKYPEKISLFANRINKIKKLIKNN